MRLGRMHSTISFAVRPAVIARPFGLVMVAVGVLMVPPAAVALIFEEFPLAASVGLLAGICAIAGASLARLRASDDIQPNEGLVLTALVFVTVALAAGFVFRHAGLGVVDALFDGTAAVTTAGLSMVASVDRLSPGLLFARAWIQWFGALGFVVLAVTLMGRPGVATRRLDLHGDREALRLSGTLVRGRRVLSVYLALSGGAITLLLLSGLSPFAAVLHGLSAAATGGYAPHDRGLAALPGTAAQIVVMAVCLVSSLSFDLSAQLRHGQWRGFLSDAGVRLQLAATAASGVAMFAIETQAGGHAARARLLGHTLRLATMAHTTAGFASRPLPDFTPASQVLMAFAMLMGGDIGGTAGGIKLPRVLMMLRQLQLNIARTSSSPHGVLTPRLGGRRVRDDDIAATLALVALYVLLVLVSWLAFLIGGHAPLPALVEVIAAVSNGGIGLGVTSQSLPTLLKAVLMVDMLAGRLEILAIAVLFYPPTWFGRRRRSR